MTTDTPLCSNCSFWTKIDNHREVIVTTASDQVRECTRPKMFWDATEWFDNPEPKSWVDRRFKEEAKDDLMFVQDGSDYRAHLLTRGNFFCAHFTKIGT